MTTSVLIADDHPLFRAALKHALQGVVGDSVYEAASLDEAQAALAQHEAIELVFLDLTMPGASGLSGLAELLSQWPDVVVVVVSAQEDSALIRRVMQLGAGGFIPKSTPLPQIIAAVDHILDGLPWVPDYVEQPLATSEASPDALFVQNLAQLTPHQYKVLALLADGLLNKQIAYTLQISESTVKQHVSAVLRKLHVVNRTQAGVLYNQVVAGH